ncbi:MAG: hypothetical protein JNK15_22055 [Planctomycetes bacterium]|nr:hypothetical protein [Planctomycetota bacterium]
MRTITGTQLQQQCLDLLANLDPDGVVVVRNGRPVARLVPIGPCADLIGSMRARIRIHGDIVRASPQAKRTRRA